MKKRYDKEGWSCMFRSGRLWPLNRVIIFRTRAEALEFCATLINATPVRVSVQVMPRTVKGRK